MSRTGTPATLMQYQKRIVARNSLISVDSTARRGGSTSMPYLLIQLIAVVPHAHILSLYKYISILAKIMILTMFLRLI